MRLRTVLRTLSQITFEIEYAGGYEYLLFVRICPASFGRGFDTETKLMIAGRGLRVRWVKYCGKRRK